MRRPGRVIGNLSDLLVSVVIPVHNGAPWIAAQLNALAVQEDVPGDWEIIASDNGSTDDTAAIVAKLATSMPMPVRVIDSSARAGLSHARNAGSLAARGEFIVFCDCDDRVRSRWLRSAVDALREFDVAGGDIYPFGDEGAMGQEPPRGIIHASFGPAIIGCNFGVRRRSYFQIGGFDESLPRYGCEDADFSLRANEAGLAIGPAPGMDIDFRKTTGLRANLRKAYLSGIAEAVVFARHPARYAPQSGRTQALRRLAAMSRQFARGGRAGETTKSAARQWVSAVGFVVGTAWHARPGRLGDPMLLGADAERSSVSAEGESR